MSHHKRIIGISWLVIGLAISVLILLTLNNTQDRIPLRLILSVTSLCIVYILAGYTLLANFRWSHWLCLPFAILTLFNFPLGTVISTYYLWYYFKHEWKQPETSSSFQQEE